MMNCSPEQKMKLKKMILEELLADVDHAEGKKLMPKPAVAVEIEAVKPVEDLDGGMGEKMNELAENKPEGKPDADDMSEDDLKKLLAEYMG